eukprot:7632335-Prorocentrum_lima.AAC.1
MSFVDWRCRPFGFLLHRGSELGWGMVLLACSGVVRSVVRIRASIHVVCVVRIPGSSAALSGVVSRRCENQLLLSWLGMFPLTVP